MNIYPKKIEENLEQKRGCNATSFLLGVKQNRISEYDYFFCINCLRNNHLLFFLTLTTS